MDVMTIGLLGSCLAMIALYFYASLSKRMNLSIGDARLTLISLGALVLGLILVRHAMGIPPEILPSPYFRGLIAMDVLFLIVFLINLVHSPAFGGSEHMG